MPPVAAKEVGHAQEALLSRRVPGLRGSARREDLMVLGAASADDDAKSVVSVSASLSLSELPIDTSGCEEKYCIGCMNPPSKDSPFTPEAQERRKGQFLRPLAMEELSEARWGISGGERSRAVWEYLWCVPLHLRHARVGGCR